jgi:hypothetical protein
MDSPPHDNLTDFEVHPQVLVDKQGEVLTCIVKATFHLPEDGSTLELADEDERRIIRMADVPWGDPEKSSILFPADLCVRKPGTDVIVVAEGFAPNEQPVPYFDVAVRVGYLQKALRVYGLRVWEAGGRGISAPRPIDRIELKYDNAWGGFDDSDPDRIVEEARNPVGMGCVRDGSVLTHQPAPNIEDPAHPISNFKTRPPPAGIGAIGRHWEPRRNYVGTYDEAWLNDRAPLPPLDQDDRVNVCASPGLWTDTPLRGGEEIALLNMRLGGGARQFFLPRVGIEMEFEVKGRELEVKKPHLDTVIIDALQLEPGEPIAVEMVWRAYVKAPRRLKDSRIIIRETAGT